jgi:hypothetical protein
MSSEASDLAGVQSNLNVRVVAIPRSEVNDFSLFEYCSSVPMNREQFRTFRHVMFGRVYLTVPSICKSLMSAALSQDYLTVGTCLRNLTDELNEPNHPELMERAYNHIAETVFGLGPETLRRCYDSPLLKEEILYRAAVEWLYANVPVTASMCQELSSGGTLERLGMMGEMYKVFLSFYLQGRVTRAGFLREVLPYFQAHLRVEEDLTVSAAPDAIELQHAERAINDYRRSHQRGDVPSLGAFSAAQNALFAATLTKLKELADR